MKIHTFLRLHSRTLGLLGSSLVLGSVMLVIATAPNPEGVAADPSDTQQRTVSIFTASSSTHAAEIVGHAEVRPRWSSTLRAVLDGMLLEISPELQSGARITEGQVLAVIDPTAWKAQLAEADNRLALAELNLLREQQTAVEARESWHESGLTGDPDSSLVLREPQISAAEVEVEAARAARAWAALQLSHTEIRAPFTGLVVARHVSRGESVHAGEPVADILATDVFEIPLQISEAQWLALPDPIIGATAELAEPSGTGRWSATVARIGAAVDPSTRMQTLHLSVDEPLAHEPPLLAGSFVRVHIEGRRIPDVLELPEAALTRSGYVWFIDEDDTLQRFEASPLFTRHDRIYVSEPWLAPAWRIARFPLESFIVGQVVRPRHGTSSEPWQD